MRFTLFNAGNGLLSIRDSRFERIVCVFFRDKQRFEAAERMADVCIKALNAAVEQPGKKEQTK